MAMAPSANRDVVGASSDDVSLAELADAWDEVAARVNFLESSPALSPACVVCLEMFQAGQRCRRTPCLHAFHDVCLRKWRGHSSKCPLCILDLTAPVIILRYRIGDLARFEPCDLRYLAAYLGVQVERGVDRQSLEHSIWSSQYVHLLSHRKELQCTAVSQLQRFFESVAEHKGVRIIEKGELVNAIIASKRFVEELDVPSNEEIYGRVGASRPRRTQSSSSGASAGLFMHAAVSDLEAALEASVQDADERAAAVNGPLASAILGSRLGIRLVPDFVVLLEVDRTLSSLRTALLDGDELANVRIALERNDCRVELESGAKLFVRPEQYVAVVNAMDDMDLKPRHIVVSQELEGLVASVIERVKHTSVKRRRVAMTRPSFCEELHVAVDVRRTFIHLPIPSSLGSARAVSQRPASY